MGERRPASRLNEVWAVWLLFGTVAVFVFITYWRLPPAVLWKTTNTGFVGGAGRAFVFISFSAALAAVATLPIVTDRLANRRAYFLGAFALVLCATVAYPGVIMAFHWHKHQWDVWFFSSGMAQVVLYDLREGSPTCGQTQVLYMGAKKPMVVAIPPGVAHGCKNLRPAVPTAIIYFVDVQFSTDDQCDEGRLPWDHFGAAVWEVERG